MDCVVLLELGRPVKANVGGVPIYGLALTSDSATIRFRTLDHNVSVDRSKIDQVTDLHSAASRSRTSKIRSAIIWGGLGVGTLFIASSMTESGSSGFSGSTVLYATGAGMALASLIVVALPSEEETRLNEWNTKTLQQSASLSKPVEVGVRVSTISAQRDLSRRTPEAIPCILFHVTF
jgi:hypothetical protein